MEVVKLKQVWHGHPAGTILKVKDDCAKKMFQSDAAEKIEAEHNLSIKNKLQRIVTNRMLLIPKKL
jgi:hypothetical protein